MADLSVTERRRNERIARAQQASEADDAVRAIGRGASAASSCRILDAIDRTLLDVVFTEGPLAVGHGAAVTRANGRTMLDFAHRTAPQGRQRVGLDVVFRLSGLAAPLMNQLARHCTGMASSTWYHDARALKLLAEAIEAAGLTHCSPAELPADLFERVDGRLLMESGTANLTNVQKDQLNKARALMRRVPGCSHVVTEPLPVDWRRTVGAEPEGVDEVTLSELLRGCMRELSLTKSRERQVKHFQATGEVGDGPLASEILECAAFVRERFPARLPVQAVIRSEDPRMSARIASNRDEVIRAAYPSARDMIAPAVMIGILARLNGSVLGCAALGDFRRTSVFDQNFGHFAAEPDETGVVEPAVDAGARIEIDPFKGRSGRRQHADFPITRDPDNPAEIFDFLVAWTAPMREFAGSLADRLFIYHPGKAWAAYGTFAHLTCTTLSAELKALCVRLDLPPITAKALRLIGVDMVHDVTGGDRMLLRAAGYWRNIDTYDDHYSGRGTAMRETEDLVFAMTLEERRRKWGIDVAFRPPGADRGSATPGWICHDPFDGPLRQRPGQLCRAIGRCPICPHADVDEKSPWALGQVVALAQAIKRKTEDMTGEAWAAKWEPVFDSILVEWLPLFPPEVADAAARMPAIVFEDF